MTTHRLEGRTIDHPANLAVATAWLRCAARWSPAAIENLAPGASAENMAGVADQWDAVREVWTALGNAATAANVSILAWPGWRNAEAAWRDQWARLAYQAVHPGVEYDDGDVIVVDRLTFRPDNSVVARTDFGTDWTTQRALDVLQQIPWRWGSWRIETASGGDTIEFVPPVIAYFDLAQRVVVELLQPGALEAMIESTMHAVVRRNARLLRAMGVDVPFTSPRTPPDIAGLRDEADAVDDAVSRAWIATGEANRARLGLTLARLFEAVDGDLVGLTLGRRAQLARFLGWGSPTTGPLSGIPLAAWLSWELADGALPAMPPAPTCTPLADPLAEGPDRGARPGRRDAAVVAVRADDPGYDPTVGTLRIFAVGAPLVFVDGSAAPASSTAPPTGTPTVLTLPVGPHRLVAREAGRAELTRDVDIHPGSQTLILPALPLLVPTTGRVTLRIATPLTVATLDGRMQPRATGSGPWLVTWTDIAPGSHAVEVTRPGRTPFRGTVTVGPGEEAVLDVPELAPIASAPTTGRVVLRVVTPGTVATLDGRMQPPATGANPWIVAFADVLPGDHDVQVVRADRQTFRQTVTVRAGADTTLDVPDLLPLSVSSDPGTFTPGRIILRGDLGPDDTVELDRAAVVPVQVAGVGAVLDRVADGSHGLTVTKIRTVGSMPPTRSVFTVNVSVRPGEDTIVEVPAGDIASLFDTEGHRTDVAGTGRLVLRGWRPDLHLRVDGATMIPGRVVGLGDAVGLAAGTHAVQVIGPIQPGGSDSSVMVDDRFVVRAGQDTVVEVPVLVMGTHPVIGGDGDTPSLVPWRSTLPLPAPAAPKPLLQRPAVIVGGSLGLAGLAWWAAQKFGAGVVRGRP